MGNQSCAGDETRPRHKTSHYLNSNGSQLLQDITGDKTHITRESVERLYRKMLQPYQTKPIQFSRTTISEFTRLSNGMGVASPETSLRVQSELKIAAGTLPLSIGASIFVFPNESDPSMIKVFVTGPAYSPYAHGLFEFDLILADCASMNPKVQFCTTGGNQVNFSVNLPASGVVDTSSLDLISLSSSDGASGSFDVSNLILSLQSLLKAGDIFSQGQDNIASISEKGDGAREYKAYCNVIKYATVQHAMLDFLTKPPPELREFIQTYFCLKKDVILAEVKKWLAEAQIDNGMYDGFVMKCNPELAQEIRNGAYFVRMNELVDQLERYLMNLRLNNDCILLEGLKRRMSTDNITANTF